MILLRGQEMLDILLTLRKQIRFEYELPSGAEEDEALCIAQAKKILIKLQAIYNLPDEGMFHKKMGEFIEELMEEVNEA